MWVPGNLGSALAWFDAGRLAFSRVLSAADDWAGAWPHSDLAPAGRAAMRARLRAAGLDLAQLYDDQFIETCAPWVVPYIGDLVGARGVKSVTGTAFRARAYVANTIGYRRRKGTASAAINSRHASSREAGSQASK